MLAVSEARYSLANVAGLVLCSVALLVCGMFMLDMLRSMWSWNEPYTINSTMMDAVLSMFGSK